MPCDIDAIINQMEWARKQGLSKLTVTVGDMSIHLRRAQAGAVPAAAPTDTALAEARSTTPAPASGAIVQAPLAGICHLGSEADSTPFVAIGDQVALGQTLCMVEAMKVMTAVTATSAGQIAAILVEDGASVNAQDALFEVRP